MNCPICNSENHQSYWFWEKEDLLMREWAMDTRLSFSICRECATIFQNPPVEHASMDDFGFGDIGQTPDPNFSEEPLVWLKQFTPIGESKGKVLEVYSKEKRFVDRLKQEGWENVKAVSIDRLLSETEDSSDAGMDDHPNPGDTFDVVICFDALCHTLQPMDALRKIYDRVADGGGIYIETNNPMAIPSYDQTYMTSDEYCIYPFHSIIFALHKAGFMNAGAEMWSKIRCYGTKTEPDPTIDPVQNIPRKVWEYSIHRFQRNYYWVWTNQFLRNFVQKEQTNPDYLTQIREELNNDSINRHIIRDVCGSCLLFANEIDTLRQTISVDWPATMSRIFEIFKHDHALFEMYQNGPIEGLGEFPGIGRYHYNEKLIYMTNTDYFKKYFSEEEARRLCDSIVQAGHVICGHLSSLL